MNVIFLNVWPTGKPFVLSLQTCCYLAFVQDFLLHTVVSPLDVWDYKPKILHIHPENLPADLLNWPDQLASFEEKEAEVTSEV